MNTEKLIKLKIIDGKGEVTIVEENFEKIIKIMENEVNEKKKWIYVNGSIVSLDSLNETVLNEAFDIVLMNELLGGYVQNIYNFRKNKRINRFWKQ